MDIPDVPDADAAGRELARHAALVWAPDDLVEFRPLPPLPGGAGRAWAPAGRLAELLDRMRGLNAKGTGIYAGVLPRTVPNGGKAKHTNGGRVLWADFDRLAPDDALARVREAGLSAPMLVVDSGHGSHVYWKLDRKVDAARHAGLMAALKGFLKGRPGLAEHIDANAMDAARVLRLPGFMNHKPPPAPCRIAHVDEAATAAPEDWEPRLCAMRPAPCATTNAPATKNAPATRAVAVAQSAMRTAHGGGTPYGLKALEEDCAALAATPPGGRNAAFNKLMFRMGQLAATGQVTREAAEASGTAAARACGLEEREIGRVVARAFDDGLRHPDGPRDLIPADEAGTDLSGILSQAAPSTPNGMVMPPARPGLQSAVEAVDAEIEDDDDLPADDYALAGRLEPLPHRLLAVPGFLDDAVAWGMNAAHYPNRPMIFASALATLATLTARKIMLDPQTRPNVYTLAIATSGVGKDTGNDLAAALLRQVGLGHAAQNRFGSGEAIEDAFWDTSPALLWLCDEIDGWLRGARHENGHNGTAQGKIDALLTFFTASHKTLQRRQKARPLGARRREGPAAPEYIHQPHLSLYGTCTPKGFFSAFNERVAGGGFLGRLLIFDADRRGLGREPTADITAPPAPLVDAARYWAEHPCGGGNLSEVCPSPRRIDFTPEARAFNTENAHWVDGDAYARHEKAGDDVGCSIWARTGAYAKKLALLYAASANPTRPVVDADAIRWGWEIARRQSERLIVLVGRHSADNPFQELCLKILNRLREEGGNPVGRSELLRLTRAKKADFDAAVETLAERREIAASAMATATRPKTGYRLRVRRGRPS